MEQEWVTASELGEWEYCRRAWWYARRGTARDAAPQLAAGTTEHAAVAREIAQIERQRTGAARLMVVALALTLLLIALLVVLR